MKTFKTFTESKDKNIWGFSQKLDDLSILHSVDSFGDNQLVIYINDSPKMKNNKHKINDWLRVYGLDMKWDSGKRQFIIRAK